VKACDQICTALEVFFFTKYMFAFDPHGLSRYN